ncbi:MAG: IclR family transcriptional regulator [Proteobacteria bacterium]|nr:MAG: IclR family transcriptional regulator [Pseudomonadota bacterium]
MNNRDYVAALEKGLAVVEAFDAASIRLTLSAVARKTGLTRAAARRYLLTLVTLGYAETDGKHFELTPRVLRLGYAYLSGATLPRIAQPILEQIGEQIHDVASLALLDGQDILFLAHSTNRRILSAAASVGTRFPAYCTAMGRALLACQQDAEIEKFLREVRPLKLTPKTCIGIRELREKVMQARSDGFAISDGELEVGMQAIAVPVKGVRGTAYLAISVSMHTGRLTADELIELVLPPLQTGANVLATML